MSGAAQGQGTERDYVLGTHDAEIQRLHLQHRVWRETVLACWTSLKLQAGARVLDVGAGPGFAALDLADIVGPTGKVVAVERSERFVAHGVAQAKARGLVELEYVTADLMTDPLPAGGFDLVWCRWVASFVSSPARLAEKIAGALKPGAAAAFHEYVHYASWSSVPARPHITEFVARVMASWRAAGGEPDVASALVQGLRDAGLVIERATPRLFAVRPGDPMWRWPEAFIAVNLGRLVELGFADEAFAREVRREFAEESANTGSVMLTPTVLEIVARRPA